MTSNILIPVALISGWIAVGIPVSLGKEGVHAVIAKLRGNATSCPWPKIAKYHSTVAAFAEIYSEVDRVTRVDAYDDGQRIVRVLSDGRAYWLKNAGRAKGGRDLLVYLLAEHRWMHKSNLNESVRSGDVVLDVGAHVGVFTQHALDQGAAKVIAFEPDPTNAECFRRNHAAAITEGRVVLVTKGAWSSTGTARLYESNINSGMNSIIEKSDAWIEIPVTRIDDAVRSLQVDRVDFVKMDIEGAEREALAGAIETLRRSTPRLMLDSYHRPDDSAVLPAIITRANPAYIAVCGPCERHDGIYVPHVTYYR